MRILSGPADGVGMSYRERIAWLTLASYVISYLPYFVYVKVNEAAYATATNPRMLIPFAIASLAHMIFAVGGRLWHRHVMGAEAKIPADERDIAIERKGMSYAYGTLLAGMILVGGIMPFTEPVWKVVNTAILAIVIAEIVQAAVVADSYRKQR